MKLLCFALLCAATLPVAIASGGGGCKAIEIDFSKLPNGKAIKGGDYLSDEWFDAYGLTLSASGGRGTLPRIFDTAHPGTKKRGDPDLGSPNERCPKPGPGRGEGGEPDSPGKNCEPLGNVLIIQEENEHPEIPDDNVDGGVISFRFKYPVQVNKIGLLDIDYRSFLRVSLTKQGSKDISIPKLGDNSAQTMNLNKDDVIQLDLNLKRSGAISSLSFCYTENGRSDKAGIGEPCLKNSDCELENCQANWPITPEQPGVCRCNPWTNSGCPKGKDCLSPHVPGSYSDCFLPVGASCSDNDDCYSYHCFEGKCAECGSIDEYDYPCFIDGKHCVYDEENGFRCMAPGDGSIGSECFDDSNCETEHCFFGISPGAPGHCACNVNTNAGCEGDFVCAYLLSLAFDLPPLCKLPLGASCEQENSDDCLTAICNEETGLCGCDIETHFPCKTEDRERCVYDYELGNICVELRGDGSLGSTCVENADCDVGFCFFGPWPPPGICACTAEEGCEGDYVCSALVEAQGIYDFPPGCYLPFGSICDDLKPAECVTGNCDEGVCTCNVFTHYPCKSNERCLLDPTGRYNCIEIGDGSLGETCENDKDCDSSYCFISQPGYSGICARSIGADCYSDEDCGVGICFFGPSEPPGVCACTDEEGCERDYECSDLLDARGIVDAPPSCYLPFGSTCDDLKRQECVTGVCDSVTKLCACNSFTDYPCNTKQGEECVLKNGSFVCRVIGDGDIGDQCTDDWDCLTDYCFKPNPSLPGSCTCNVETNVGCTGDLKCDDLFEAQGIVGASPDCFLQVPDLCDEDIVDFTKCNTGNCDEITGKCICNEFTSFPCDTENGEECRAGAGGVYACIKIGDGSLGSNCTEDTDCDTEVCDVPDRALVPDGYPGTCVCDTRNNNGCEGDYECFSGYEIFEARRITDQPNGCYLPFKAPCVLEKAGECLTGYCDLQETICACSLHTDYPCDTSAGEICLYNDGRYNCGFPINPCPQPDPTVICPTVALRVNCQGCEYLNQCQATSADHYFSVATCYEI